MLKFISLKRSLNNHNKSDTKYNTNFKTRKNITELFFLKNFPRDHPHPKGL